MAATLARTSIAALVLGLLAGIAGLVSAEHGVRDVSVPSATLPDYSDSVSPSDPDSTSAESDSIALVAPAPLDRFATACTEGNPFYITPCYALGERGPEAALVAFRDTPDDSDHYVLATYEQIGATYGVAFDRKTNHVYAAAYHKRAAPFGPGGPGMIYRVDLESGDVVEWLDVPDAGLDWHDPVGNFMPDTAARDKVGLLSLGDIELDEAGETLFAVNLFSRKILRYRVADGALVDTISHGADGLWWAEREARPFGLAIHEGMLYHTVLRDASGSGSDGSDLIAYVYESALDGSDMRTVLSFRLDYPRQRIPPSILATWLPWRSGLRSVAGRGTHDHAWIYPMPMLADLEFSATGDMILGIRDRLGDMTLYDRNRRLPRGERSGHPFGDILFARQDGVNWTVDPWPEHFSDAGGGGGDSFHMDTSFGGLATNSARDVVMNTAVSPIVYHSGGAIWFDIESGGHIGRETLYQSPAGLPGFGKANGLGDAELACVDSPATPTPTATSTPTSTPTPEATATPTPTATPSRVWTIYLPYGENLCVPEKRFVDVVLVLDRSTSMLRAVVPGGLAKNEAAIDAAARFIEELSLEPDPTDPLGRHDQVSVVGFNDTAWTEVGLTNDRSSANAALERLRTKTIEGTRLDLAITQGQAPLDGPERIPENDAIIVLLTDGLPNRVPFDASKGERQEDTVLRAANEVRAAGSTVYTIGLGTPIDINPRLLISMATERFNYSYAPLPEDLEGIYRIIADEFTFCGREKVPPPEPCIPEHVNADIMLVLDMSTSMRREGRDGRMKWEAALDAARLFALELDLERDGWGRQDQLGIVGFNGEAWTETTLTEDRGRIALALDRLPERISEGTRLDLALEEGLAAWHASGRIPENRPVMVLLTDGLPNRVPTPVPSGRQEDTVLAAADRVKGAGMRIFTIGLGLPDDVLRELLESVATSPRDHYFAPDGEDLADIYRQIAGRVSECP